MIDRLRCFRCFTHNTSYTIIWWDMMSDRVYVWVYDFSEFLPIQAIPAASISRQTVKEERYHDGTIPTLHFETLVYSLAAHRITACALGGFVYLLSGCVWKFICIVEMHDVIHLDLCQLSDVLPTICMSISMMCTLLTRLHCPAFAHLFLKKQSFE